MKLESWKVIDKTTVCVSDTAANMLKMMEYLPNNMEHNDCLNHVFQLSINDEILEKPLLQMLECSIMLSIEKEAGRTLMGGYKNVGARCQDQVEFNP